MLLFDSISKKAEEERKKQALLEFENSMRVVFVIENYDSYVRNLVAIRHDGVRHKITYNLYNVWFPTRALAKARKILINEIELITGRPVLIVLSHDQGSNI